MKKVKIRLWILFFLYLLTTGGCDKLQEDFNQPEFDNPLKIGVVGDVSVLREQVENMFYGAKLASEEINQNGGLEINGENYKIELIYKNSGGSAEEGLKVCHELIDEGVNLIVGPTFSSVAIDMANYCVENDVLMMSYSATSPELTTLRDSDLVWRTCPSDFTFGTVSAQFCYDSLKMRKAAIFYRDDIFGKGLSTIIKNTFEEKGGLILSNISYPGNQMDLTTYSFEYELNSLLAVPVDVIYIVSFNSEIAILTNKIYNSPLYQAMEKKPYLFVNDGNLAEEIIANSNPNLFETVIGITSTNEDNPNYNQYKNNYIHRFGFSPATYSENAYDAIYCLSYAMLRANSSASDHVASYLREISGSESFTPNFDPIVINVDEFDIAKNIILKGGLINYDGASGPINFDDFGDPFPKIVIWTIINGNYFEVSHYNK